MRGSLVITGSVTIAQWMVQEKAGCQKVISRSPRTVAAVGIILI